MDTRGHPNAGTAGVSGGLAVAVVYLLGLLLGISLTASDGAAISVAVITIVLLIGRHGLCGILNWLWWGDKAFRPKEDE